MSATVTYIRSYLTRIVIIVGCIAMLISYYFVSPQADTVANELRTWSSNIGSFTLFVGIVTIFMRYGRSIWNRGPNWLLHLYCLAVIVLWIPFGTYIGLYSDTYQNLYLSTKITLHVTIIGEMIFFCISAMYRTFRIRSLRTAVLSFLAMLLIVFNAPWLTTSVPKVGDIAYWLLDNPQMAAARSMVICAGIGGVILSIRILLGLERGALRVTGGE